METDSETTIRVNERSILPTERSAVSEPFTYESLYDLALEYEEADPRTATSKVVQWVYNKGND